jgi:uncharacterized membrane protein HdeD (DUF308 family)
MSAGFPFFVSAGQEEIQGLRRNWGWFLALGLALMVVGMLAILRPGLATYAVIKVVGWLLVIGGGVELVSGIWARRWAGFFLHLLGGLLYIFLGALFLRRPGEAAWVYTLLLAVFLVATGLFRVVMALSQRFTGWGWTVLSGAVSFILGILIWQDLPDSAYWVIGTFVGIELIFNGWSWVMIGMAARTIPERPATA